MDAAFSLPSFQEGSPLYEQLYQHIAAAIRSGEVAAGSKLPSKRRLCALAGVSMSTVETAYALLAAEGYVISRPKSGYTAADLIPMGSLGPAGPSGLQGAEGSAASTAAGASHTAAAPATATATAQATATEAAGEEQRSHCLFDLSTSAVDVSLFPFSSWARINKEAIYENPGLLQRGHGQGDLPLRTALADLLAQYRGVRCNPDQVVVGAGTDYLLSLLLQLLPEVRDIALEDPGYPAAYSAVLHHDRRPVPVPVDQEGMEPEALAASGASLAYVTPSHQFPLGSTMPAGRRSRLLHWAAEVPGRYLIEDDYDSEFRWSSRPVSALQGMDRWGRVVYLGTFSRSIAPAIRAAYLILPPELLERYRSFFPHTACTISRFEQEGLRRFLVQGLYGRHLRRSCNLYREKNAIFTQKLLEIPGVSLSGHQAGLHFTLTLPRFTEEELVQLAAARSVRVTPLSRFCHSVPPIPSTVVLGFAGLTPQELEQAADLLREAYSEQEL